MCHHKAPHRDWEPSLQNLTRYDGVTFPEPPTLFDDYAGRGKAEHEQNMMIKSTMTAGDLKLTPPGDLNAEQKKVWEAYYGPRNALFTAANLKGDDLIRWKYQRYMHDYMACIDSIDGSVGKLLDYLKQTGLDKNTIVVYSSDQGFYLGEHGWFDKRWIFEEIAPDASPCPLARRCKAGVSINRDIVSDLDFAETFLDAARRECTERDAGQIHEACACRQNTGRLAKSLLLPLLRASCRAQRSDGSTVLSPIGTSWFTSMNRNTPTGSFST